MMKYWKIFIEEQSSTKIGLIVSCTIRVWLTHLSIWTLGAPQFYWEDESQEEFIKWLKDDPEATFFPSGELLFADEAFSQDGKEYLLFWKFDIYAHGEKLRVYVYVNAMDGSIGHYRDALLAIFRSQKPLCRL